MADTYANKYLDGVGLAYLWEKIKDQRAKIAQLDLSEDSLTLSNTNEGDKKYFNWLTSSSQDVMIEDTSDDSRRYYFTYKDKEGTLDAFNWQTFDSMGVICIRAVKNGDTLTITKTFNSYTDPYGHKINDFLQAVQFSDSSINVKNGASTTELNIQVDNTNGTLTFKPNASSTTSLVLNKITNATYATKLGNATTSYSPETTLTSNSNSKIPTSKAVATYVTGKVAEIDQFKYVVSTDAATTPKDVKWEKASGQSYTTITGTLVAGASTEFIIYLVPATVGNSLLAESGSYVEYLTVKSGETYKWEQIGTTKTDLSDYQPKHNNLTAISGIAASARGVLSKTDANTWTTYAIKGSKTQPIYIDSTGTIEECSTYAGGTKVKLNGSDQGSKDIEIYAPTTVGTSGQILKSTGGAPTWVNQSTLSVGSAIKATQDGSGNNIASTYVPKRSSSNEAQANITNENGEVSITSAESGVSVVPEGAALFSATQDGMNVLSVNDKGAFFNDGNKDYRIVDYSMTLTTGEIDIICADN